MIKGIDSTSDQFLADLGRISDRQNRVQNQISTGLLMQRASEAPARVTDVFRIKSLVEHNNQIDQNLIGLTAEVNTSESAIRQGVQILERVHSLAVQTVGNTSDAKRPFLALEVKELHAQLVNLTRSASQGRLVFSGDLDQQLLYTPDWTQAGGVARLTDTNGNVVTATNTRLVEDQVGSRFSISKSAHEIFDARNPNGTPALSNVFQAVYNLGKALENDDPAAVAASIPKIQASLDQLNINLTFFGNAQNRVKAAVDSTKQQQLALAKQLSDIQDTDIASALVELNLVGVQQQTALAARSKIPKSTLFDFLG